MIITASIDLLLSAGDVRRSYQVAELTPSDVMSSLSLEMVPFPPSQPAVNVDSSPDLGMCQSKLYQKLRNFRFRGYFGFLFFVF